MPPWSSLKFVNSKDIKVCRNFFAKLSYSDSIGLIWLAYGDPMVHGDAVRRAQSLLRRMYTLDWMFPEYLNKSVAPKMAGNSAFSARSKLCAKPAHAQPNK